MKEETIFVRQGAILITLFVLRITVLIFMSKIIINRKSNI